MEPQRSMYTRLRGLVAFSPFLIFGTGKRVCFPKMQCSHLGAREEVLIGIPSATLEWAMSRMVRDLQWPKHLCQESMSGKQEV